MPDLQVIASRFDLGSIKKHKKIFKGLLHETYDIQTSRGEFIVQKVHPAVVRPKTCVDAQVVSAYLNEHHILAPTYILSRKKKPFLMAQQSTWRVMKKISGSTPTKIKRQQEAYNLGSFLGRVHASLKGLRYKPLGTIAHFHDTPYIYKQFLKAISSPENAKRRKQVEGLVQFILSEAPKQFLPADLPKQVIHGDPKISNFLFSGMKPVALIDFDTCMLASPLIDLGDALRSWSNAGLEDGQVIFKEKIYRKAIAGYKKTAHLSKREIDLIPQALRLITIELAMRFLKDYFEDCYFAWDPKRFSTRRAHNVARVKNQISFYMQITGTSL